MERRSFIKLALSASGSTVLNQLFPNITFAQNAARGNFILIHCHNGWDISLFSDPWLEEAKPASNEYFIEYSKDQLIQYGSNLYGPALAPLKSYLHRISVVNGIFMSKNDLGHTSLANYMLSGAGTNGAPAVTGITNNSDLGVVTNTSFLDARPTAPLVELSSVLRLSSSSVLGPDTVFIPQDKTLQDDESRTLLNVKNKAGSFQRIGTLYNQLIAKNNNDTDAAIIAATLASKVSNTVQLSYYPNLDTHSNHEGTHKNSLIGVFSQLNNLLKTLEMVPLNGGRQTLLDNTTIVMVSEFCRTPALNPQKGKDHNPQCNSALIMGPGIARGKKIGSTQLVKRGNGSIPYLAAMPVDKNTEAPILRKTDVKLIQPQHVLKTALLSVGVSEGEMPGYLSTVQSLNSLIFKS